MIKTSEGHIADVGNSITVDVSMLQTSENTNFLRDNLLHREIEYSC